MKYRMLPFVALGLAGNCGLVAQEKTLEEVLAMSLQDLANMQVVSVLKAAGRARSVPATVRVITGEQIRENGYLTLEDVLADLPGFQFRNILGFNSYVFMRGLPQQNNKILLLVDGIQVNELNSGGFYGGGQFNLGQVERIEVVYGPASALYGTNAMSGVINLVMRDPREASGGRAEFLGGTFATAKAAVRFGDSRPDAAFGYTVSALLKRTGKADLRGEKGDFQWSESMENDEKDLALDAQVRFRGFRAGWMLQDKDASRSTVQPFRPEGPDPVYLDRGTRWHIRFLNAWLNYTYDTDPAWTFRSTLYHRDTSLLDDSIPVIEARSATSPGRQYRYTRPNHMLGNETQVHWMPKARWRFSAGVVLERERLAEGYSITQSAAEDQRPPVPASPSMRSHRLLSGFVQAQIPVHEGTDLFLGLRHDDSDSYGRVQTPRIGLIFNRDRLDAKLLYGKAFRAPKPWDYTDGLGNPGLQPETFHSYEFSGAWSISASTRLELSLYRNRLDNLLSRASQGADWQWVNAGIVDTEGGELVLEHRTDNLRVLLSYTYTASVDEAGIQVPEITRHGATAGLHYTFRPGLRLGLRGQYSGARTNPKIIPATGNDRIEPAFVVHGTFNWTLSRKFDLQLQVNNLTDVRYYHPSNLAPSRYRQAQRSVLLQLGCTF